mmetsp:Transcript_23668/g.69723  ORF Transcript_23668/g.69723 Transcript_23668/m.69723 type:complete len:207 (+) Transcript_23668:127-747(+)
MSIWMLMLALPLQLPRLASSKVVSLTSMLCKRVPWDACTQGTHTLMHRPLRRGARTTIRLLLRSLEGSRQTRTRRQLRWLGPGAQMLVPHPLQLPGRTHPLPARPQVAAPIREASRASHCVTRLLHKPPLPITSGGCCRAPRAQRACQRALRLCACASQMPWRRSTPSRGTRTGRVSATCRARQAGASTELAPPRLLRCHGSARRQ